MKGWQPSTCRLPSPFRLILRHYQPGAVTSRRLAEKTHNGGVLWGRIGLEFVVADGFRCSGTTLIDGCFDVWTHRDGAGETGSVCKLDLEVISHGLVNKDVAIREEEDSLLSAGLPEPPDDLKVCVRPSTRLTLARGDEKSFQMCAFAAHAAGVSSATHWMGTSASPGRMAARYSRTGTRSRRQLSMTNRMAATRCSARTWRSAAGAGALRGPGSSAARKPAPAHRLRSSSPAPRSVPVTGPRWQRRRDRNAGEVPVGEARSRCFFHNRNFCG